jgi:hypothetical protein
MSWHQKLLTMSWHSTANRWQPSSDSVQFHKIPIISFPEFLTAISFAYFAQRQLHRNDFSLVQHTSTAMSALKICCRKIKMDFLLAIHRTMAA